MNSRVISWKSVVITFIVVTVFYAVAYSWLSRRQTGKGPWQVTFTTNAAGTPRIVIEQPVLGISNVIVQFEGEQLSPTNHTGAVRFATPRKSTPFGYVAYDDLMFQPGIVALDCFGHVVEMAPVSLGLNGKRVGWTNQTHSLISTDKLSAEARRKLEGGYVR
jgi:hypothetical protein